MQTMSRMLPAERHLEMPAQDLSRRIPRTGQARGWPVTQARAFVVAGAALLTAIFGYELYRIVSFIHATPLLLLFLALSTATFSWVALGTMTSFLGYLMLIRGRGVEAIDVPPANGALFHRTALLFPVFHEDPAHIAGTVHALAKDLARLGQADTFDIFILSDTKNLEEVERERATFAALAGQLTGVIAVYYRHRRANIGKKPGNIKDWVTRFGGAYPHFVVLDADSIMSAETLKRLALAMQADPSLGLLQTAPRLIGGTSLFQRLHQFASAVYGPLSTTGLAAWHGTDGNYWGHNAIIRTAAFASAAGLPVLPGRPPFGGQIRSHDFVEAGLLLRAGWKVAMAPALRGTYEGSPPCFIDLASRERRWVQGNMQHLAIISKPGLTTMGRVHLGMGVGGYLSSTLWLATLLVGLAVGLQSRHLIPAYFRDEQTLFPIWPVIDADAALRLFVGTMAVVLLPKLLGYLWLLRHARPAETLRERMHPIGGILAETLLSMLYAPIAMAVEARSVIESLAGRDSGWKPQRRTKSDVGLREAAVFHRSHVCLGVCLAVACVFVSPEAVAWMSPVILGLTLSAPLTWWTARPPAPLLASLLSTEDDRRPPLIVQATLAERDAWSRGQYDGMPPKPVDQRPKAA